MEIVIRIIVSLLILALLALEGSFVYFWLFKRGKNTSIPRDPCYAEIRKCPVCGSVIQEKKEASSRATKCLEHHAV